MIKYVPYITTCIDDEFGVQTKEEYDDSIMYDTCEEAEEALEDVKGDSDGEYGILELEDGAIIRRNVYSDDSDDYIEPDDSNIEVDFDPYVGAYVYEDSNGDDFGGDY